MAKNFRAHGKLDINLIVFFVAQFEVVHEDNR